VLSRGAARTSLVMLRLWIEAPWRGPRVSSAAGQVASARQGCVWYGTWSVLCAGFVLCTYTVAVCVVCRFFHEEKY